MTPTELLRLHGDLTGAARELIAAKSHDYSGDQDTFANFRAGEFIVPAEKAVLSRMMDKMSRLATLCDRQSLVKSESIRDTILDVINYAVIFEGIRCENRENLRALSTASLAQLAKESSRPSSPPDTNSPSPATPSAPKPPIG